MTSVSRWDVTDISNPAKALTTSISYNVAGSLIRNTDPSDHQQNVVYNDSFSDGQNNRNTFAYPTTATDGDGYSSYAQYNFDFGAVTRTQGPPPAGQSQGAIRTMTYDAAGRIQWVNNVNNGAWKYTTYADRGDAAMSQVTINAAPPSYWSITVVDGANRVRLVGGDHPGSITGPYSGAYTLYDVMGRVSQQSNPAETDAYWSPTGDDAAGWVWTQQTYDWQGRPVVTTNPDGTTKEAIYGGCGCAGGAVVTLTDEGTIAGGPKRQQMIYSDVLGRTVKTEVLNWQGGSVYAATVNSYNGRDQVTQVRQYAGAEGSGTFQDTTMTYDGYGRLKTRHLPQQNAGTATTWDYNADDTIQKITDTRGASQTFTYNNNRHLVNLITYAWPGGGTVPSPVGFDYDAAGNRTSMTDGLGSMSYQYDSLSRLTSETRTFTGVGNFQISYSYNLAGQLTSVADPFNGVVSYVRDSLGRTITVNGSGYGASQFLSNLKYRAWGGLRLANYGNGFSSTTSYNARLQPAGFELRNSSNQLISAITLQYYSDGRPRFGENPFDERFDRAFSYDQAGRLWEAYSGSEARDFKNGTQGATPTGPFKQSYQYDAIGHLAGRTNRFWSQSDSYTATHVNNRNQNRGWHYDAAGNATQSDSMFFSYDAAGRNSWMAEGLVTVTQSFDGDGQVRKRVATDSGFPTTTYFVCSTVLGGKAIAEVDPWGQRQKAFIYARGKLIAIQLQGNVLWQHEKPVVGTQSESTSSGLLYFKSEPEPMGVNMGSEDPYLIEEGEPPNPDMPSLVGGSAGVGRCTLDGARFDCEQLGFLNDIGAARPCPNGNCGISAFVGRQGRVEQGPLTVNPATGSLGFLIYSRVNITSIPTDEDGNPTGPPEVTIGNLQSHIIDLGEEIGIGPQNPDIPGITKAVNDTLANPDCAAFARTILNGVSSKGNPVYPAGGSLADVFSAFLNQKPHNLFTRTPPPDSGGYGNPIGNIKSGTAAIYSSRATGLQTLFDADTTISELFHLAGQKRWYSDKELATALSKSSYAGLAASLIAPETNIFDPRYVPRADWTEKNQKAYSGYFHTIQQNVCHVLPGTHLLR